MKLQQALCYYLPHKPRALFVESNEIMQLDWISLVNNIAGQKPEYAGEDEDFVLAANIKDIRLILRDMSDLTKEIEHEGERFIPIEYFEIGDDENNFRDTGKYNIPLIEELTEISKHNLPVNQLPFDVVIQLIIWHFDVFRLIEKEQAINYNKI